MRKFSACRSSLDENGDRAELGDPLHEVGDLRTEQLLDALNRGARVLDHVVEQAGHDRDDVEAHVRENVRNFKRMDEVGLAGMAHLSLVLERREHVGAPEQLDVGVRDVRPDFFDEVLEPNHGNRCLTFMIPEYPKPA